MANNPKAKAASQTPHSHKVRTFFASVFGVIGVYLIISSISVIWLNQTLTNTNVYVKTVSPLVTKPAIQNFIAAKVADQITKNAPVQDIAASFLPPSVIASEPSTQIQQQVNKVIQQNVLKVIQSPNFATLWESTNRAAHQAVVQQLNSGNLTSITLDLSPAINGVVSDLKTTQLAPAVAHINLAGKNNGVIVIKSKNLAHIHQYYQWFKEGTLAVVLLAILAVAASIWLSVHHGKTARRILFASGILLILQGLILEAPAFITVPSGDPTMEAAAKAFAGVLVHNLQVASLALGVIFVIAAVGSKLYATKVAGKPQPKKA